MEKPTVDQLRDEIIEDFCHRSCPESMSDYCCPDHGCPAWRVLTFCSVLDLEDGPVTEVQEAIA